MGYNFNISSQPEYELYRGVTDEYINLYGLVCKYIITTKVQKDFIWGEYSHIKIDNSTIYELPLKMMNDTSFDGENLFTKFGFMGQENSEAIVSAITMEGIHPNITSLTGNGWDSIIGNLVIFPNGKIMEVVQFKPEVDGLNNLFPYSDRKNVYKLILRQYSNNNDETTSELLEEIPSFGNLEEIFNVDSSRKEQQEATLSGTRVPKDSVFGDLG